MSPVKHLVAIDVGNTSTAIARVTQGVVSHVTHIKGGINQLEIVKNALKMAAGENTAHLDGVVIGSVVVSNLPLWELVIEKVLGCLPLVVSSAIDLPLKLEYPKPETIGADRIANSCGAVARYGSPIVVADFGTALTFDVINKDNAYIGGVIAPGLPVMTEYLHEKTELLPAIELGGDCLPVGTSTEDAMRIGAHVGYRGMAREIFHYLCKTVGEDAKLCATGGFAGWAMEEFQEPILFDPELTLFGLAIIFDHQKK